MQLRTELIPYIKESAKHSAKQGIPIMRPTVYDFQDDTNTYEQSFEYMFGDKYLVAPIYKPESETNIREIYLPGKNTTWTHYFSGEKFQGGQVIKLETGLEEIPVFKR
jgi:alpha-glucosidase (family GH31 glycosyl hydrolase)